jgi:hypothetical protein
VPEPINKQQAAHICKTCGSSLVQPVDWVHVEAHRWQVSMRCPECYAVYDLALEQDDVNEFSYQLEHGFQCLLEAIEQLDHQAFECACETFISAMWADAVLPMDF